MVAELRGIEQLVRLSVAFKGTDKLAQTSMRARLRLAVAPIVADVVREATSRDIPREVPGTIRAAFSYTPRSAGVRILADNKRMPQTETRLPSLFEFGSKGSNGRYIRHPVFGHGQYTQPIKPFFYDTIRKHSLEVEAAMNGVLDDFAAYLAATRL